MIRLTSLIVGAMIIAGCAGKNPADPYESYNRKVYAFNTTVDQVLLKPLATGYKAVTPNLMREGVGNAYANILEPRNMVNNLLQGKIVNSVESLHRFVFNSTFGLVGLIDLTNTFRLPEAKVSDFGMTLAYYGWEDSNYFLLPFLPPRTMRDQIGLGVDAFGTNPVGYAVDFEAEVVAAAVDAINSRAEVLAADNLSKSISLDDYVFQRESILQYRNHQLRKAGIDVPDKSYDDDDDEFSISDIARQNAAE